ncbi:MAG: threonine synthase, partial [Planctomycetota bacterium]
MKKTGVLGFRCMGCQKEYSLEPFRYTCPECGENLDCLFDYKEIQKHWTKKDLRESKEVTLWRYLP